jgi:Bacterial Ig domain/Secretion system C-terminal sorting domain/SprB repeat
MKVINKLQSNEFCFLTKQNWRRSNSATHSLTFARRLFKRTSVFLFFLMLQSGFFTAKAETTIVINPFDENVVSTNPPTAPNVTLCQGATASPLSANCTPSTDCGSGSNNATINSCDGNINADILTNKVQFIKIFNANYSQSWWLCDLYNSAPCSQGRNPSFNLAAGTYNLQIQYTDNTVCYKNNIVVGATTIKWYNQDPSGGGVTALTTAPTPSTTNLGTTYYWVTQTIGGIESAPTRVTVTVKCCNPPPTVANVNYCVGATASPLTTVSTSCTSSTDCGSGSNNATINACPGNIKVNFLTNKVTYIKIFSSNYSQSWWLCDPYNQSGVPCSQGQNPSFNLPAGTYNLQIQYSDFSNCYKNNIVVPPAPVIKWYSQDPTNGGVASLSTAPTPSTATAGVTNYWVTQTINSCEGPPAILTVTVTDILTLNTQVTDVKCASGSDGKIVASASGGTNTFTYGINPNTGIQSPTGTFYNLTAQAYTVTATDGNGCRTTKSATVGQPADLTFDLPLVTNVSCKDGNNGRIVVSATGGTGTKTYTMSPNVGWQSPAGTFNGLTAQTYAFTASDANGCIAKTRSAAVQQPTALVFSPPSVTNVTCAGGSDGTITVSATGGTGTITYKILPNIGTKNGGTFSGLTAQTYSITATDANGCTATQVASVGIRANTLPTVTLTSPTNGSTLASDATITANASDPDGTIAQVKFYLVIYGDKTPISRNLLGSDNTAPYSFNWANITNGNYNIQAEAIDNCGASVFSTIVSVSVTPTFLVAITSPTTGQGFVPGSSLTLAASVTGFTNRTVVKVAFFKDNTLLGEDLTAPYTYLWNNVPSGSYFLRAIATDNTGGVWSSPYTYIFGINTGGDGTRDGGFASVRSLNLSPNPATNQVTIKTAVVEEGNYGLNIVDALGRVVLSQQESYQKGVQETTLNVSKLPKGIYVVRCAHTNGQNVLIQKLLIE